MQDQIPDFQALIALWPSMRVFGREVCGDTEQGRIFFRRNRVPRKLHPALIRAAIARGLQGVDQPFLDRLYDAGRKQGR